MSHLLPHDMWTQVFGWMEHHEIATVALVCKDFHSIITSDHCGGLWSHLFHSKPSGCCRFMHHDVIDTEHRVNLHSPPEGWTPNDIEAVGGWLSVMRLVNRVKKPSPPRLLFSFPIAPPDEAPPVITRIIWQLEGLGNLTSSRGVVVRQLLSPEEMRVHYPCSVYIHQVRVPGDRFGELILNGFPHGRHKCTLCPVRITAAAPYFTSSEAPTLSPLNAVYTNGHVVVPAHRVLLVFDLSDAPCTCSAAATHAPPTSTAPTTTPLATLSPLSSSLAAVSAPAGGGGSPSGAGRTTATTPDGGEGGTGGGGAAAGAAGGGGGAAGATPDGGEGATGGTAAAGAAGGVEGLCDVGAPLPAYATLSVPGYKPALDVYHQLNLLVTTKNHLLATYKQTMAVVPRTIIDPITGRQVSPPSLMLDNSLVYVWTRVDKQWTFLYKLEGHTREITDLLGFDDTAYTASVDGRVFVWNLLDGTGTIAVTPSHDVYVIPLRINIISPDTVLALLRMDRKNVVSYHLSLWKAGDITNHVMDHSLGAASVTAIASFGDVFAVARPDNTVHVYSAVSGELLYAQDLGAVVRGTLRALQFSRHGLVVGAEGERGLDFFVIGGDV